MKLNLVELTAMVNKAQNATCVLDALTTTQEVFNGYGQHTAMDLLHTLTIWPGMPSRELCADEDLYARLRAGLHEYASQYVSAEFQTRCLLVPNQSAALAYNYKSDINYINQYVAVYRKCNVDVNAELYNRYAMLGMFDPQHVIGQFASQVSISMLKVYHRLAICLR